MADLADMASTIECEHLSAAIARVRAVAVVIGMAGECEECGHFMRRLVDGRCGFCRDGRLPPDDWEPPTPPADFIPKPKEISAMPAKTIQLPAYATDAIAAVEAMMAELDCTTGEAARILIERGARAGEQPAGPIDMTEISLQAPFEELERRIAGADAATGELIARAERAESKLATIREAMA